MQRDQHHVDRFDADERRNNPADAINDDVIPQQAARSYRGTSRRVTTTE
jgi:hypothetical protein